MTPEQRIEIANRIIAEFDTKYTRVPTSDVIELYQKSSDIGCELREIAAKGKVTLATPACTVNPRATDMGINEEDSREEDAIDTTIEALVGSTCWITTDQNDPRWDGASAVMWFQDKGLVPEVLYSEFSIGNRAKVNSHHGEYGTIVGILPDGKYVVDLDDGGTVKAEIGDLTTPPKSGE